MSNNLPSSGIGKTPSKANHDCSGDLTPVVKY
jgi:hypothetical protein